MSEDSSKGLSMFWQKHRYMLLLAAVVLVVAAVGAILVYLWFVGQAQANGLVPGTLGLWSMGTVVTFLLHLLFWEVLIVGIPLAVAAIVGWSWWRRLPPEEARNYRFLDRRSRSGDGGNAFSLLVFIAFCLKVYTDGNWDVAFATWSLDYLVSSLVTALVWIAIIFGIPLVVGLIWWLARDKGRRPAWTPQEKAE